MPDQPTTPEPDLSFFGVFAVYVAPFLRTLSRYLAIVIGAKLPDWVDPALKTEAFWLGLVVTLLGVGWGFLRTWRNHVKPTVAARRSGLGRFHSPFLPLVLLVAFCVAGCASPYDGVRRGPFLNHSINKAYRLAEQAGCQQVRMGQSGSLWVYRQQLAAANALLGPVRPDAMTALQVYELELKQRDVAMAVGKTDDQIVSAFNPGGRNWAIFGEASLWTTIAGGITAAIAKLTEGDDDDGSGGSSGSVPAGTTLTADQIIIGDGNVQQRTGDGGDASGTARRTP